MRKSKFTDSQIMDAVKRIEAGFGVHTLSLVISCFADSVLVTNIPQS
jgi:hypothetical protein